MKQNKSRLETRNEVKCGRESGVECFGVAQHEVNVLFVEEIINIVD